MTNSKQHKRFPRWPRVLQDELWRALTAVQAEFPGEQAFDRLQLWRKKPYSMDAKFSRLDLIFELRHRLQAGGAGDYASRDVHRWFQQQVAKGRRQDDAPIVARLVSIGYQNIKRGGKKRARLDTAEMFKVSESHINGVIRRAGLQSKGNTTSGR